MDDVLPGVIIDGVLGVDLTEVNEFMAQMDPQFGGRSADLREKAQNVSINFSKFQNGMFLLDVP
jgi:hypothetical protein